ncbi:ADP-ribose pyrophosphatase YjhB, NUDIX family [bacterium A37T11]|nr:ADP-ribose pyrophosphatase YjhB, NUDIX family [bacterium A37T11]
MNESALIVADFSYIAPISYELIDIQGFQFKKLYFKLKNSNKANRLLIRTEKPKALFRKIKKSVSFIKAAGGLVKNGEGNYLFIQRLGRWDLPKGKMDRGEKMRQTAVREVTEECGITVNFLGEKILSSYHSYEMKGKLVIKKTNWYEMSVDGVPPLVPQLEEDITEARWLHTEELGMVKNNTYPAIKDILEAKFGI